jgi:hypothetical protein
MESKLEQDHPREVSVKPGNRFLRFGLAGITALVLSGIILGATYAAHMFPHEPYQSGWAGFEFWRLIAPFALALGLAAAAYPRRWLSLRRSAFIVAAVGAAVGCLFFILFLEWVVLRSHVLYHGRGGFLGTPIPLAIGLQMTMWLIAAGASGMLVTLTRRVPALFIAVAVLCLLAVVLPRPVFNLLTNPQQLTVAFVVPVSPGASAAQAQGAYTFDTPQGIDPAEAKGVAPHVLEALRTAGLVGQYRVVRIWICGSGKKKSLQIIVLNPPLPAQAQLPQPNGTELIYVAKPDGWQKIPAQAPTLGRSVEVRAPRPGWPWLAEACIPDAAGLGPCPAIPPE